MIVGISGYMGSGKDTVAKIIQYVSEYPNSENRTDPHLGYRSFNSYIMDQGMQEDPEKYTKWKIRKWAGKLKQIASILTGIPIENFEDQEFKKTEMGAMWGMSVREFLQKLGTNGLRDGLHKDVWVNALMSEYKLTQDGLPNWIISDTRFFNEAQAIKDQGGIIIRVNRYTSHEMYHTKPGGGYTSDINKSIMRHPSETSLDNWDFDVEIENNGTIEDLIPKVKWIMETYNLL